MIRDDVRDEDKVAREMRSDLSGAPSGRVRPARVVNAIPRQPAGAPAAPPASLPPIEARDLGRLAYRPAWELQKRLVEQRLRDEIPDVLLIVEHEPVITTGRGTQEGFLRQARF